MHAYFEGWIRNHVSGFLWFLLLFLRSHLKQQSLPPKLQGSVKRLWERQVQTLPHTSFLRCTRGHPLDSQTWLRRTQTQVQPQRDAVTTTSGSNLLRLKRDGLIVALHLLFFAARHWFPSLDLILSSHSWGLIREEDGAEERTRKSQSYPRL